MTRYQELQNNLKPAIPLVFLTDTDTIRIPTSGIFLHWDSVKIKTSHFNYTANDDRVQLSTDSAGFFRIHFEISIVEASDANRADFWIYKNGSVVADSKSASRANNASHGFHVGIFYYMYLEKGDYIQIYANANGGNVDTLENTSRLSIEFIPMKGWNNSSGGRTDYKGGVMR